MRREIFWIRQVVITYITSKRCLCPRSPVLISSNLNYPFLPTTTSYIRIPATLKINCVINLHYYGYIASPEFCTQTRSNFHWKIRQIFWFVDPDLKEIGTKRDKRRVGWDFVPAVLQKLHEKSHQNLEPNIIKNNYTLLPLLAILMARDHLRNFVYAIL